MINNLKRLTDHRNVFQLATEMNRTEGALMGQQNKKSAVSCLNNGQGVMPTSTKIVLYVIALTVIATLFAQSLAWLLQGIDQLRIREFHQVSMGEITAHYEPPMLTHSTFDPLVHSIFSLLALPSILTWLLGIIAAKIGDSFIDLCWLVTKRLGENAWNKIKTHYLN